MRLSSAYADCLNTALVISQHYCGVELVVSYSKQQHGSRSIPAADIGFLQVGDDEDEVRLAQAQVLMDCLADLLSQKGLDGTRAWCEGGLKLRCTTSEEGNTTWIVIGQLPEEEGQG